MQLGQLHRKSDLSDTVWSSCVKLSKEGHKRAAERHTLHQPQCTFIVIADNNDLGLHIVRHTITIRLD